MTDVVRDLLARVDAGELGDPLPVLAYLAGEEVEIPDEVGQSHLVLGRSLLAGALEAALAVRM